MRWRLANDLRELRDLRRDLTTRLQRRAAPESDVQGAVLAASELVTNAISYSDDDVEVELVWRHAGAVLTVADLGPGFDPTAVPIPDREGSRGRGLDIVTRVVEELQISANEPRGSIVTVTLPVRSVCVPVRLPPAAHLDVSGASKSVDELERFQLRPVTEPSLGVGSPIDPRAV